MKRTVSVLAAVGLALSPLFSSAYGFYEQEEAVQAVQSEEAADYYRKWLTEDVVYIISDEERSVFEHLATPEEKETFIEQFWFRRDPDPRSAPNEFKDEHYRRIAYANEMYACGKPGWKTDRGRIYIIHGPPNEIQSHPSGGSYQRPSSEGGGTTVAYPFETWRYRNIEGLGDDIILEFVDKDYTGTFNLSHMPEDKDALLLVPGAGPTLAEEAGMATRGQRPIFAPGSRNLYPMMTHGYRDNPFYRYEVYSRVQAPQPIKYKDLQELVKVEIDYTNLPVIVREDYFRLNEVQDLVPITIQIQNKDLTFEEKENRQVARVAVYGLVTGLTNRVALEFDDDLVTTLKPEDFQAGLRRSSIYQRIIPLDRKMRYKMDIVAKDLNSGHVGVVRRAIVPPSFDGEEFSSSSLILADSLKVLDNIPDSDEMFVLGDVKVRPNLKKEFFTDSALSVYLQLYNAGVDQTTMKPELSVRYRLLKQGQVLHEILDEKGSSIQFFSSRRIVLVKSFALEGLPDGDYQLEVIVKDLILNQSLQVIEHFRAVSG